jgi:hypothetical protein
MIDDPDLVDKLHTAWRQTELKVEETPIGTAEHDAALRQADAARHAYRTALDAVPEDDGRE